MPPASPGGQAFVRARDFVVRHCADYERAIREFAWPQLDAFNWALDYFDPMADGNASPGLFIVEEDGRTCVRSFAELSARSNQVANLLRARGLGRGDRLLLMVGNEVALWETLLAAMKLGVVVSPASGLLTRNDLQDRITRGRIRHVVANTAHAAAFDGLDDDLTKIAVGAPPPGWQRYDDADAAATTFTPDGPTGADDPFLLYFTSGTTAKPKMVLHTHRSYPVGHLSTLFYMGLRPGDRHWNISSPGWAKHAWSSVFAPWNAEATTVIYNYARFQPRAVLQALVDHRVTTLCAPPTVWRMLVQEPLQEYDVSLREALSAGEPLNAEVIQRVQTAWHITIRDGYGQTETTAQIGNSPGQVVKPGSMGRPLVGCPIVLLDPDGCVADEGEVCIDLSKGPVGLTVGYAGDEDATAESRRDGYYHTGDVARRDADGYLTFVGRADDVFKAADYRISPFELESALIEHPAVAEAAVVPSPDPIRHAVPKAFIVLAPHRQPSRELALEILAFARDRLAPFKRIRRLEFAELPKTVSGKIRRVELRAREEELRRSGSRAALEFFEDDLA